MTEHGLQTRAEARSGIGSGCPIDSGELILRTGEACEGHSIVLRVTISASTHVVLEMDRNAPRLYCVETESRNWVDSSF